MIDENEMHNASLRAVKAQELLDNELMKSALDAIEAEVITMWGNMPQGDKDGKEALWQLYKTSKKFRGLLLGYIETGKLARHRLDQYEKESKLRALFRAA